MHGRGKVGAGGRQREREETARRLERLAQIEAAIQAVRDAEFDEVERLARIHSAWDLVVRAANGRRLPRTLRAASALAGEQLHRMGGLEEARPRPPKLTEE